MKIWKIMAVIPIIALIAWLSVTAYRVNRERDRNIWHLTITRSTGAIGLHGHGVPSRFVPRFWDALIGRDWTVGYACSCGIGSNPNVIEVGRAARNEDLLQKSNAWAKPYQRSMELAIELDSRRKTVEHNQAVIERLDRDVAWAAWNGSWIHGSEGVRRTYQEGIDNHLAHIARARALLAKYQAAALHPWDSVEPDPPSEARGGSTK